MRTLQVIVCVALASPQASAQTSHKAQGVRVLADGGLLYGEDELGALFTADFHLLKGQHYGDQLSIKHIDRSDSEHIVIHSAKVEFDNHGLQILCGVICRPHFVANEAVVAHDAILTSIVSIADQAPKDFAPPDAAVFYLAEIRIGTSVNVVFEGRYALMGSAIDTLLATPDIRFDQLPSDKYNRLEVYSLGTSDLKHLSDRKDLELSRLAQMLRGTPSTYEYVFRELPGKNHFEAVIADDTKVTTIGLAGGLTLEPGRYKIVARTTSTSTNDLELSWDSIVDCDDSSKNKKTLNQICTVVDRSTLAVREKHAKGGSAVAVKITLLTDVENALREQFRIYQSDVQRAAFNMALAGSDCHKMEMALSDEFDHIPALMTSHEFEDHMRPWEKRYDDKVTEIFNNAAEKCEADPDFKSLMLHLKLAVKKQLPNL